MLDDEIVFLGTSSGSGHRTSSPPLRPVTGIALHVEKQGPIEEYGMLFRRANTSVVHIGRRSGLETSDTRSQDHEQQGTAMFRCAVVSRRHAKIAFSDSGHAYLIDLGSHHGTHIRKPADKFSKMIKPETPTLLADGDIVTFGKSVGKGDECVRPIVARIELLHVGQNTATNQPAFKPLVVPPTASPSFSDKSVAKSASGRYGVNRSPSSSSDESYSSNSGIYSDIEEIPPPASSSKPAASAPASQALSQSNSASSSLGQAFDVLKRLLPPSHPPSTPKRLPSVCEIVERPLAQMSTFFFGPESVPTSPGFDSALPLPGLGRQLPPMDFLRPVGFDASEHDIYEHDSIESIDVDADADAAGDEDDGESIDDNDNDNDNDDDNEEDDDDMSRSHSPMDLASPSPAPEVVVSRSLSIPPPPAFIISPTPSPRASLQPIIPPAVPASHSQSQSQSRDIDISIMNSPELSSLSSLNSEPYSPLTDFLREAAGSSVRSSVDLGLLSPWEPVMRQESVVTGPAEPPEPVITPPPPPPAIITLADLKPIQNTLESLKTDVAKLQSHRRKYKARFNSNVHVISEKLSEFDDRLLEVNAEYMVLTNQMDNVIHVDVSDLNAHLEAVQEQVDEFVEERDEQEEERRREKERDEEAHGEEKRVMLEALKTAVQEMKDFRESTKMQIEEELAAIKQVREAAAARLVLLQQQFEAAQVDAAVTQAMQAQVSAEVVRTLQAEAQSKVRAACEQCFTTDPSHSPQTPVLTSLKRKRDDTDENGDEDVVEGRSESEKSEILTESEQERASAVDGLGDVNMDIDAAGVAPSMAGDGDDLGLVEMVAAATSAPDAPPPRKRARRFASVVAQTATAVTIGAVVTWSALAFS